MARGQCQSQLGRAAAAVCNNTLYFAGGSGFGYFNDVHRLAAGSSAWIQDTAAAPWNQRYEHQMTAVGATTMVLTAGADSGEVLMRDVWLADCSLYNSSLQWTELSNAPWSARQIHGALVWRDKLWVLGGWDSFYRNDVWSLALGGDLTSTSWVQETAAAEWAIRGMFGAVVFDDAMYVIGGSNNGGYLNDVWRQSYSPGNWVQLASAPCSPRHNFGAGVAMHRIVMVGGTNSVRLYDSCSFDGSVWQNDTVPANGGSETAVRLLPSWQGQLWWLGASVPGLGLINRVYITASSASNATSDWVIVSTVSSSSTAGQSSTAAAASSTGLSVSSTGGSGCAAATCAAHAGRSGISVGWMQAAALIAMIVAASI